MAHWWDMVQGAAAGGAGWWLFSTLVRTMPAPLPGERWYGWAYAFLQTSAANHDLRKGKEQ